MMQTAKSKQVETYMGNSRDPSLFPLCLFASLGGVV